MNNTELTEQARGFLGRRFPDADASALDDAARLMVKRHVSSSGVLMWARATGRGLGALAAADLGELIGALEAGPLARIARPHFAPEDDGNVVDLQRDLRRRARGA